MKRSPSPAPPLNKKPKANASNVNSGSTRKRKHEEITSASATNGNSQEASDLTKGMDAPVSQPLVEEVQIPKNANIKKENSEYQPYRNGSMADLDEDNNQHSNEENKVSCWMLIRFHLDLTWYLRILTTRYAKNTENNENSSDNR